ncbi:cryptochrome-1-like [Anopheles albimanus]|uniref:Photolyase/cryptochrome alpha/beta domain-containing protein n=1 Tax=Anopheles albimanus TaxID=7167 RepID=A0A182FNH4_ANOAL|nr:cryptochrome-1-like [Anopheles albimanus]
MGMTKQTSSGVGHYSGSGGHTGMNSMATGSGNADKQQQASSNSSLQQQQQQTSRHGQGSKGQAQHHLHQPLHAHHQLHHHLQQQQHPTAGKLRDKHTVHWFRKGLRLHDNPALREGVRGATSFRCVFVIDPWFAGSSNVGINKWRFLLQCLDDLDRNLRKLNSRLFVIRGQPADALPKLFKEWGTTCLTFEEDPEPFGRVRDHNISEMCKELGIEVISAASHTLYNLERIIEKNGGRAPLTYHQFQAIIASMDAPPQPETTITLEAIGGATTPLYDDHDDKYGVPTLEELGFETEALRPPVWIGGETEALARLERHLERKAWVASFGRPKMTPQSLLASQTGLSPYLRFGCLSTRLFYYQLTDLYKKIKKACPPLSLHGQLLWREFFYCAATKNPTFDKMAGNPICVQIPWDRNSEALAKWASGQTGFPWIDAIMTQLREEGWIHHLARHAVACFLTRGDLWISWEEGMKVFEELLLDADWSVNAGMWMWLSCSSFFQQFFHCYCPVKFGRKADPNGDYIRRYLPVLKNFPTRFIHEPWNAPENVQRAAKCLIGKDYPLPMVNHAIASRANMERIKQVYQHLAKYRTPGTCYEGDCVEKGGSAIAGVMTAAKMQHMNASSMNDSPSPTTILTSVNSSGNYMCRSNPSAQSDPNAKVLTYHPLAMDGPASIEGRARSGSVVSGLGGGDNANDGSGNTMDGKGRVLTMPESALQQQQQQQRQQQQQQQHLQHHQQQQRHALQDGRSSNTVQEAYGNLPTSDYPTLKTDSGLATMIRGGNLTAGRFTNLQDQLSNSLLSLECEVMATKLEPNNYEYERSQNMYNSQFKVEYSDNFNSGYGLRNAVFYGRKREDEQDNEQDEDEGTGDDDNDREESYNDEDDDRLATIAMSPLQDTVAARSLDHYQPGEPHIKQEAKLLRSDMFREPKLLKGSSLRTRTEHAQQQQRAEQEERQCQHVCPQVSANERAEDKHTKRSAEQPSNSMLTDCDYDSDSHKMVTDYSRQQQQQHQQQQQQRQ